MAFTNVNIGTAPDSGDGDTIRNAFILVNNNFLVISNAMSITGSNVVANGIFTINVSSTGNALRITQTGAGNSLVVEDETNPDSTPFVVDATGNVGIGVSTSANKLTVNGTSSFLANITVTGALSVSNLTLTTNSANIGTAVYVVSGGNVGISNTAPDAKLAVTGTANVSGNVIIGGGLTSANLTTTTNTTTHGTALYIVAGGNVGISNTAPDAKLAVTGTANISGNVTISSNTLNLGTSTSAANGYTYLPNGLKLNWGWVSANNSTGGNATFTSAYTTNAWVVTATSNSTVATYQAAVIGTNNTVAQIRTANAASTNVFWTAIGT